MAFAQDDAQSAGPPIFSISAISELLRNVVSETFGEVWVVGEISNCLAAGSGHCYLTLKDSTAQLRAVIWRNTAQRLKFAPEDGLEVIARGRLDVYAPRGTYQLVIEELHPRGMGAAELALRKLRDKLAAEGLFDAARKRPLPKFPRRIGIVTSPTGAAIRDFLEVLRRRWQGADVLVFPARVQGDGSAKEIAQAIRTANRVEPALDVLIVARGGGSSEDLWSFNDEGVIRAMVAARMPVVSAVGHEIDVTLADLAADVRALTPSEAAERVVPSASELREQVASYGERLKAALAWRAVEARRRVEQLAARPPFRRPFDRVLRLTQELDQWHTRTRKILIARATTAREALAARAGKLDALSPLRVLQRGYSVTTRVPTGEIVDSIAQVGRGEALDIRVSDGRIQVEVVRTESSPA